MALTSSAPDRDLSGSARRFTRRHLLGAVTAAVAGATGVVTSQIVRHGADDELLALRPQWQDALAAFNTVLAAKAPIEARCFARKPPSPQRDAFESQDRYADEVARADRVFSAIQRDEGLIEIERQEAIVLDAYHAVVDRIIALRATTMSGLLYKAEVSRGFDHTHDELMRSIVEDLVLFGGPR